MVAGVRLSFICVILSEGTADSRFLWPSDHREDQYYIVWLDAASSHNPPASWAGNFDRTTGTNPIAGSTISLKTTGHQASFPTRPYH
jgi:hypothetical protein